MGRPMLKICAKKGCDVTDCTSDPAQQEGVDFSVQVCFFRGLDSSSESQVPIPNAVLDGGPDLLAGFLPPKPQS